MRRIVPLLAFLAIVAPVDEAGAQDVEMLGRRYGTPVPAGYTRLKQSEPDAFEFTRAWIRRGVGEAAIRNAPSLLNGASLVDGPSPLGPRSGPVVGTFTIPVVLGLFSNSGSVPPFSRDTIAEAYFGAGPGTITDYYDEVSRGSVALLGTTFDWVTAPRPDTAYAVGESGLVGGALGGGGTGNFIVDLLDQMPGVNWGLYDNDGPDGIPNSGDDDGFVDVLAVVHPTKGGECGGAGSEDRIWSHRWSLSSAVRPPGQPYVTTTPTWDGTGMIRINDYTIQPAISCVGGDLGQIGVFTHELGHAFGLPDLYDTCSDATCSQDIAKTSGAGIWDLMASGSWGCNNAAPQQPCHMGAWSKAALGWVNVVTLAPDMDHGTLVVEPVETSGTVYRVDARDGSGEYFLIENRQRMGYDQQLYSEGILVWQIDPVWIGTPDGGGCDRWCRNRVNANQHMGVWLRQADGQGQLQNGVGRGDAGDPFPGQSGNRAFHTTTTPGALSWPGGVTGLTMFDIVPSGDDISLRLLTRTTSLTVSANGAASPSGLFTVNGAQVDPPATTFLSAPFVEHTIEAASGESTAPGERTPFVGWVDDASAPRTRSVTTPVVDTEYVANYQGSEFELDLTVSGGVNGVAPGTFASTPASADLWFPGGVAVSLEAVPETGFDFLSWSGSLAGQPNPATFTLNAPVAAGADFDVIYGVPAVTLEFPAATDLDVQFEVENGTLPVRWTLVEGELPVGVTLSGFGRLTGAALDLGRVVLTFDAVDAIGLSTTGVITLDLVAPLIPIEQLTSIFLLTGPPLSTAQINFLNRQGNGVGPYEVGDFRAWVLANPTLPLSAAFQSVHRETVVIPTVPAGREVRR
jgi:M6 family metalloprotease-like protein